jgi:hypothetical protein
MRGPTGWLRRSGSARYAGFVLALVVVAAGCTSEPDQPATLPDDTPTATSATASPSPMTPEQEVEAAVRAYYDELTRAAQTQETSVFKRMVTRGCPCFGAARAIDETRRNGHTTPDVTWTVDSIKVLEAHDGTALAEVRYTVSPYTVLDSQGEVVDRYSRQRGHVDLSFVRGPSGWVVGNLFDLES